MPGCCWAWCCWDGLSIQAALVGFVVVLIAAALLPTAEIKVEPSPRAPGQAVRDNASVAAFADALTDPCIVLDRRAVVVHSNGAAKRQFPNVTAGNPITFSLRNPDLVQAIDGANRTGTTRTRRTARNPALRNLGQGGRRSRCG